MRVGQYTIMEAVISNGSLYGLVYDRTFECQALTEYKGTRCNELQEAYRRILCDDTFHALISRMGIDVDDLDFYLCESDEEELFIDPRSYEEVEDGDEPYLGPVYDVDTMGEYEGETPFYTAHGIEFALWGNDGQGYFFSVIVEPEDYSGSNVWCFNDDSQTAG